ncbi:MAG TPA: sugar phosphate nucleotidyltransferase [Armatimonadota bacterium]|jgi:UTP--glucose-1-phosphate uridylyltransferase
MSISPDRASSPGAPALTRAVVPAAGLGTRLLPLTRAQPKEMLPVGMKPVLQWVIEELAGAGLRQVLVVTAPGKDSLQHHFAPEDTPAAPSPHLYYTLQAAPRGLGDAVLCGADFVGVEDFVVALGDCAIIGGEGPTLLQRLVATHREQEAAATFAVQRVSPEHTRRYGMAAVAPGEGGAFQVSALLEKPGPERAPSPWAVCARYVFCPRIFPLLRELPAGVGGEIQLTDAIAALISEGLPVRAVPLTEKEIRLDVGNQAAYARAFVRGMLADNAASDEFAAYLASVLDFRAGRRAQDPDRLD